MSGGYADGLGKLCPLTLLGQDPLKDVAAEAARLWNGQSVCAEAPGLTGSNDGMLVRRQDAG